MKYIFIYDGSFEGFLAAMAEAFYQGDSPEDIREEKEYVPSLFSQAIKVEPVSQRFKAFVTRLGAEAPPATMRKLFCAYLSGVQNREMLAYRYLDFAFRHGNQAGHFLSEEAVSRMEELFRKVLREAHRMQGLVRFKELSDGILYAPVETDHNVLPLISPHFFKRMRHGRWIIHDLRRQQAAVNDNGTCRIMAIQLAHTPEYAEDEYFYQRLWKEYFKTIAIESRLNPRLQRQFLPQRYWKYLVEVAPPEQP